MFLSTLHYFKIPPILRELILFFYQFSNILSLFIFLLQFWRYFIPIAKKGRSRGFRLEIKLLPPPSWRRDGARRHDVIDLPASVTWEPRDLLGYLRGLHVSLPPKFRLNFVFQKGGDLSSRPTVAIGSGITGFSQRIDFFPRQKF